jgi:hypothetical protein
MVIMHQSAADPSTLWLWPRPQERATHSSKLAARRNVSCVMSTEQQARRSDDVQLYLVAPASSTGTNVENCRAVTVPIQLCTAHPQHPWSKPISSSCSCDIRSKVTVAHVLTVPLLVKRLGGCAASEIGLQVWVHSL